MEYLTEISQIIGTLGFPIAMCLLLFNYIKTEQSQTREVIEELKDTIQELSYKIGGHNDF